MEDDFLERILLREDSQFWENHKEGLWEEACEALDTQWGKMRGFLMC
jgi:hypothetical protein